MKTVQNIDIEMDYVKAIFDLLKMNDLKRNDTFSSEAVYGQPHYGGIGLNPYQKHDRTSPLTLEAMENRDIITPIRKTLVWSDGTRVEPNNLHAGTIYEKVVYEVTCDNFKDYLHMLVDHLA